MVTFCDLLVLRSFADHDLKNISPSELIYIFILPWYSPLMFDDGWRENFLLLSEINLQLAKTDQIAGMFCSCASFGVVWVRISCVRMCVWTCHDRLRVLGNSGERWHLLPLWLLLNAICAHRYSPLCLRQHEEKKRRWHRFPSCYAQPVFSFFLVWFPSFVFLICLLTRDELYHIDVSCLRSFAPNIKLLLCDREKDEQFAASCHTSYVITRAAEKVWDFPGSVFFLAKFTLCKNCECISCSSVAPVSLQSFWLMNSSNNSSSACMNQFKQSWHFID